MKPLLRGLMQGVLIVLVIVATVSWVRYASVELPGEIELPSGEPRNTAQYIPMRDGVRLAVDVWLPEQYDGTVRLPTVMRSTRYWRATHIGSLARLAMGFGQQEAADAVPPAARSFNEAGYAVVLVDVRGSGASFGERPTEFGRDEALDLGEVAAWIAERPWSNGRVGTWGVSYEGNTAAMAAVAGHPAVTAIAPQYADFDAHAHLLWPGGTFAGGFIRDWGTLVTAMDRNDICALAEVDGFACRLVRMATSGVKPVDGGEGELRDAVAGHRTPDIGRRAAELEFKDDAWGAAGETVTGLSIHGYQAEIERSGVPVYSWAGWMDAGTVDGALALFSTFDNPVRLSIGPWSHGGGFNTDPFLPDTAPTDPSSSEQFAMLLEFFDHHVRDASEGPGPGVGEIAYYTFGEGWRSTRQWPPEGLESIRWHFGSDGTLQPGAPGGGLEEADTYAVDYTHSTGSRTRWHTQLGGGDVVYGDRADEDRKLLTYTSAPLEADLEITGTVEVDLFVSSTHADGAFFAYLEIIDSDGRVRYVTEGQLRALHRASCEEEPPYPSWGPCHPFTRDHAAPMVPNEPTSIRFGMFNTSVLVPVGHRIRIALGGHDASVFDRYPAEGDPVWTVYRSSARPSGVVIPTRER